MRHHCDTIYVFHTVFTITLLFTLLAYKVHRNRSITKCQMELPLKGIISMKEIGLYIHIPYCAQKCLYCDFNSYEGCVDTVQPYVDALIKELQNYLTAEYVFKTVFIGGGTPTFIEAKHIERIMNDIKPYLCIDAEITIESNPGTVTSEKLKVYRDSGMNRISMGLQAWQNDLLKTLGRIHTIEEFLESYKLIKEAGFKNINIDLMFALPGQTMKQWKETIEKVSDLDITHISAYSLIVEEDTPFYSLYKKQLLKIMDEDMDRELYHLAIKQLEQKGYVQYEISNFAKRGYQSRHNKVYWHNEEYIGIGAGATSRIQQVRYSNETEISNYIKKIKDIGNAKVTEEILSKEDSMWETLFLGLRLNQGILIEKFEEKYEIKFMEVYKEKIEYLLSKELIEFNEGYLRLTSKGIDLSNQVFILLN